VPAKNHESDREMDAERASAAGRVLADLSRSLATELGSANPWCDVFERAALDWDSWSGPAPGRPRMARRGLHLVP
jgi:hypothetical protein